MREVEEWRGKNDDAKAPPHVRLRIFNAHGGICHISGRKIGPADKWDLDHIIALCNGGENRESNLAPALADKHKEKTADDVSERAETDRMASRHLGIKRHKHVMDGSRQSRFKRKMDGTVERRQ